MTRRREASHYLGLIHWNYLESGFCCTEPYSLPSNLIPYLSERQLGETMQTPP